MALSVSKHQFRHTMFLCRGHEWKQSLEWWSRRWSCPPMSAWPCSPHRSSWRGLHLCRCRTFDCACDLTTKDWDPPRTTGRYRHLCRRRRHGKPEQKQDKIKVFVDCTRVEILKGFVNLAPELISRPLILWWLSDNFHSECEFSTMLSPK